MILENTNEYLVQSDHMGAGFVLTRKPSASVEAREAYIQFGDASVRWHDDYDAMIKAWLNPESVWHCKSWNECLAELIEPYIVEE